MGILEWIARKLHEHEAKKLPHEDMQGLARKYLEQGNPHREPDPERAAAAEQARAGTEEAIPGRQGVVARQIAERIVPEIRPEQLSFGGGTVLAARWNHRTSLDVDLFCRSEIYEAIDLDRRRQIEERIKQIPEADQDTTWCESTGIRTRIGDIEATVLPRDARGPQTAPERTKMRESSIRLQRTEEILKAKISARIYESNQVQTKDLYDIACAHITDPEALSRAVREIDPRAMDEVIALVSGLPEGWSTDMQAPLLEPKYQWDEREMTVRALAALIESREAQKGQER